MPRVDDVVSPLTASGSGALDIPVCVDLDGTLLRTDSLWESLLLLVRDHPGALWRLPLWLFRGKAGFKREIARLVVPDATTLPYREEVLERLRTERAAGRRIYLCTAADERIARAVADHLGCFDGIAASDGTVNRAAGDKLAAVRALVGAGQFDYIGDGPADVSVFRAARRSVVVNPSAAVRARLRDLPAVETLHSAMPRLRAYRKALRLQQWSKNVLVFVPLVLAHQGANRALWGRALWAFAAFCLAASAIYIVNDLLDLESDRRHARKRHRPFASGALSIPSGLFLAPAMIALAFGLSVAMLPWGFTALLAGYVATTLAYSLHLKRRGVLDVLVLAGLYTLRLLGGAVAVGVAFSHWLGAFSMFLFLSLAFVKRYTELMQMEGARDEWFHGRGYNRGDVEMLRSLGPASGYLAVMVLALYLNSEVVTSLYQRPAALWLIAPLLLYWITRMWLRAHRGQVLDDPIITTVKDKVSYLVALLMLAVFVVASG